MTSALLEVHNCWKTFEQKPVLRGVDLVVQPGEIVALLGPSGCGKSTLLRTIAGLETPDRGDVRFAGQSIVHVPPHQRGFGLMFQDWALFPHKHVFDNIAFGLKMQGMKRDAIKQQVSDMLDLVGLHGYERRSIYELSGGEKQRVALARSLAPNPRLLMLDEPLGSLDQTLRERLTLEIRDIIKQAHVTAISVTHDHNEAWTIADRLVLMDAGMIVQTGSPQEIYDQPATTAIARFLQLNNIVPVEAYQQDGDQVDVETKLGTFRIAQSAVPDHPTLLIHPTVGTDATPYSVVGTLERVQFRGGIQTLYIRHESGLLLEFEQCDRDVSNVGESVIVPIQPTQLTLLG
ncbi:MAG: ABC transporter ATP-binding protein [Herpetosiphon sp.]|nr:ABC transporter ATP-binding protein [Herpetosiphon sp.]